MLQPRRSVWGNEGFLETGSGPPRRSKAGTGQVHWGGPALPDEGLRLPAAHADTWCIMGETGTEAEQAVSHSGAETQGQLLTGSLPNIVAPLSHSDHFYTC